MTAVYGDIGFVASAMVNKSSVEDEGCSCTQIDFQSRSFCSQRKECRGATSALASVAFAMAVVVQGSQSGYESLHSPLIRVEVKKLGRSQGKAHRPCGLSNSNYTEKISMDGTKKKR